VFQGPLLTWKHPGILQVERLIVGCQSGLWDFSIIGGFWETFIGHSRGPRDHIKKGLKLHYKRINYFLCWPLAFACLLNHGYIYIINKLMFQCSLMELWPWTFCDWRIWEACVFLNYLVSNVTRDSHPSYRKRISSYFVWQLQYPTLTVPAPNYLELSLAICCVVI
jgi:hypothetical protein